ncbi:mitogen-activated protein kinase kinase kinase 20-like [Amphiura filiformis]|uniref:mitogen-activated protein kinase kinase kinase 20-like n=1 Tax=Amphiura filiformis TaxID=82378 RepID=UPI003B20D74E
MSYTKIKKRHLTFQKTLYQGAFSTVYKASWWETCMKWTDVAAKKVDKLDTKEIEIMSSLNHTNIVNLLGVVDESPEYYLILELCSYRTLREGLDKLIKCDNAQSRKELMEQAVKPLQYLKQKRIVHHEITSQNYVFSSYDFGILKLTKFKRAEKIEITSEDKLESYPWTAPESLHEVEPFPTSDIFSLGVVLWEILTLQNPFQVSECAQIPAADEPDVKEAHHLPIPDDCPEQLAGMMKQCWHKDWKKRPCIEHVVAVITREEFTMPMYQKSTLKCIEM